jgi:hypothetical protein
MRWLADQTAPWWAGRGAVSAGCGGADLGFQAGPNHCTSWTSSDGGITTNVMFGWVWGANIRPSRGELVLVEQSAETIASPDLAGR